MPSLSYVNTTWILPWGAEDKLNMNGSTRSLDDVLKAKEVPPVQTVKARWGPSERFLRLGRYPNW